MMAPSRPHFAPPWHDRRQSGRELAESLYLYQGAPNTVIIALPRGGVPVGYEIAQGLGLPLDVVIVRKLGFPGNEELAMGAIASGGLLVVNDEVLAQVADSKAVVDAVFQREVQEMQRREVVFRGNRPPLELNGRSVILVDDGLATGASMQVAIDAVKNQGAREVIVAVPVGPPDTLRILERSANQVICLQSPPDFMSVGDYYRDFAQTTDAEVQELLAGRSQTAAARDQIIRPWRP